MDSYRIDVAYQQILREHAIRWLQFDSRAHQPPLELEGITWDVIIGQSNLQHAAIATQLQQPPYAGRSRLHIETSEVPSLLAKADIGLIAAGTLSYEAAAVGLPMLLICMADNQQMNIDGWTRLGAGRSIGAATTLEADALYTQLRQLLTDSQQLNRLSQQAYQAVDGRGIERLAEVIG